MVIPKTKYHKNKNYDKIKSKTPKNGIKKAYPLKSKIMKIEIEIRTSI
jgi:hypothetical protein